MALSEEQWTKLYDLSVANSTDIEWIRKTLTENARSIKDTDTRLQIVENAQSFAKGRMMRFTGSIAAILTIVVNGILWAFGHYGCK